MKGLLLLSLVFLFSMPASTGLGEIQLPAKVKQCLEASSVKSNLKLLTSQRPLFLKGDFDGDGAKDYALAVKRVNVSANGVLICEGNGNNVLLGANNPKDPPFTDMYNDNFVAPQWKVVSIREAHEIYDYQDYVQIERDLLRGNSIGMIWEDAICLIYWDGKRYRWGCGQ